MRIDQLGEFGLIDRIRAALPPPDPDVLVGIGDDVAVVRGAPDRVWLATCDVQVEGSHFLRSAITARELGAKSLAINLSDIASAGGTPRFALVSLGLPSDVTVEFVDELYAGMRAEAEPFDVDIVGGNLSKSTLGLFVDVFLMGEAPRENVLLRSGAQAGDKIAVTGTLGDSAAGVALLLNSGLSTTEVYASFARERYLAPTPRVREGEMLGGSHLARAMVDISDGLASDLGHICERSEVGARVFADKLPVDPENRSLSLAAHGDEWHLALFGGEDYELLFTASPENVTVLADEITRKTGTRVSIIGEILPDRRRELVLPSGRQIPLASGGWDHFK